MKKVRWIILIILLVIWLWIWWFYAYKFFTKADCQEFIDECYSRAVSEAWGRMVLYEAVMRICPKDCSRYTEERWYFKDEDKKEAYLSKKVKGCEEKVEECLNKYEPNSLDSKMECPTCDEYWNEIYLYN